LIGAVFDGDATGPGPDDPQLRDRYGLNVRVNDLPLFLWKYSFCGTETGDSGLDGKWRHFGTFTDERFAPNGVSLADPATGSANCRPSPNESL
jgi:porin